MDMLILGNRVLNESIFPRLDRAQDIYDQSAPPLKPGYQKWKMKRYGSGIRDLKASGRTRRGTRVVEAGQRGGQNPYSYVTLGFSDPVALDRIRINQLRARQWGLSPKDKEFIVGLVATKVKASYVTVIERVA